MKQIVLLNGPPSSGKDTLAFELSARRGYTHMKFATPLAAGVQALFSIDRDLWQALYTRRKEDRSLLLEGMSPREAMIWLSEEVMKQHFGDDFFGRSLFHRIMHENIPRAVVSDSGFKSEAEVLREYFGPKALRLVRLHRPGCDFRNDSRGYISLDDVHALDIQNTGSVAEMTEGVLQWLDAQE